MATAQGRRRHAACLLRFRENCPFRRLRRARCYDIQSASAGAAVEHWAHCDSGTKPPPVCSSAEEVSSQPPAQADVCLPVPQIQLPQQQYDCVAVDIGCADAQPADAQHAADPVAVVAPDPAVLGLRLGHQHQNLAAQPSNGINVMELDGGVDPETGEKAQG